jgi:6-phosphogluconolactonase
MEKNLVMKFPKSTIFESLANKIGQDYHDAISTKGYFSIILSGGSSPKALYHLLPDTIKDWSNVYLFLGDERSVPMTHDDSNQKMINDTLISNIEIPRENIFFPDTMKPLDQSFKEYDKLLSNFLKEKGKIDTTLLGLGDDAHTLSLFPHTKALSDKSLYTQNYVAKLSSWRLTGTYELLNNSENIYFLVIGKNKENAINAIFGKECDHQSYPAQRILDEYPNSSWYIEDIIKID